MFFLANSGGGFLQLKGESSWEDDEASILTSHGLGVLHVADLVCAISTLPLYTQLNMPEESLPVSNFSQLPPLHMKTR